MKKTMPQARMCLGFTLMELIIAIAVSAILLSWGWPSIQQSIRNSQVLAQGNELVSLLHFAKSEALRRNTEVPLLLATSDEGWTAVVEDPAELANVEGCVPGQLRCSSNTGVSLTTAVAEVVYNNRGYIRSVYEAWTPETLFVEHHECVGNKQRRRIDITPTGQISSCSLPCASQDACP